MRDISPYWVGLTQFFILQICKLPIFSIGNKFIFFFILGLLLPKNPRLLPTYPDLFHTLTFNPIGIAIKEGVKTNLFILFSS